MYNILDSVCLLSVSLSFSHLELTFAWIFNEYPYFVQQDSRRFISQETGSLYIAKVEPSDVGNYTCVVNNTVTREKVLSSPTPLVLRSDGTSVSMSTGGSQSGFMTAIITRYTVHIKMNMWGRYTISQATRNRQTIQEKQAETKSKKH